jgi:hypothetical protein
VHYSAYFPVIILSKLNQLFQFKAWRRSPSRRRLRCPASGHRHLRFPKTALTAARLPSSVGERPALTRSSWRLVENRSANALPGPVSGRQSSHRVGGDPSDSRSTSSRPHSTQWIGSGFSSADKRAHSARAPPGDPGKSPTWPPRVGFTDVPRPDRHRDCSRAGVGGWRIPQTAREPPHLPVACAPALEQSPTAIRAGSAQGRAAGGEANPSPADPCTR